MKIVCLESSTQAGLHIGEKILQQLMPTLQQLHWVKFWQGKGLPCFMYVWQSINYSYSFIVI